MGLRLKIRAVSLCVMPFVLSTEGEAGQHCRSLFHASNRVESALAQTQADRLAEASARVSPQQRQRLFTVIGDQSTNRLLQQIREGQPPAELADLFRSDPQLALLVVDLLEFADAFPGIRWLGEYSGGRSGVSTRSCALQDYAVKSHHLLAPAGRRRGEQAAPKQKIGAAKYGTEKPILSEEVLWKSV